MATFDLLSLQPHKVSRDLTGYITYIYGEAKTGKTTLATQAGTALLFAFERGYNALPGVFPVDVTSWGDVRSLVRELKKKEVKEKFQTVIFDTVDIAGTLCEKYICAQNGVDKIGEIPYGQGWTLMKKEFEEILRTITQLGYALFLISHEKDKVFKRKDGTEYNQTVPSCPTTFNEIAKNVADIYGYAEKYGDENGVSKVRLVLRSKDNSVDCGCRFKFIEPIIEMSYKALVEAINTAIDKEAELTNGKFVTNDRNFVSVAKALDYDALLVEFNNLATSLMEKDAAAYGPKITFIVDKYLGRGKKVSDSTPAQVELIDQIVSEIKDTLI
jgi:hypothetical protein